MIKNSEIKEYLEKKYKRKISDLKIKKLGSGVLGTGYLIEFKITKNKKRLILKSLIKEGFTHDYLSDRAASLIRAHEDYNLMENHVKSEDVIANKDGRLTSIGNAKEFYILMQEARGKDFFNDFDKIKKTKILDSEIKKKIMNISDFLVKIHKKKHKSSSIYRRKMRETISGNGSIIEMLDFHSDENFIRFEKKWFEILKQIIRYWRISRNMDYRLCEVHGDFHPGNIWFENEKLIILDRARGRFGEPADDITSFIINPIMYSLILNGKFDGPFKEMYDIFWNNYFKKTKDREMRKIIAPYLAFKIAIVTNPIIVSNNLYGGKEKAELIREKLINLALNVAKDKEFSPEKINYYLENSS